MAEVVKQAKEQPSLSPQEQLNTAFVLTDEKLIPENNIHSGCTAVACYIVVDETVKTKAELPLVKVTLVVLVLVTTLRDRCIRPMLAMLVLFYGNLSHSNILSLLLLVTHFPSRDGIAVRLTYDHKGSDARESKRIKDKGGFMLNSRVNGNYTKTN